MVLGIALFIIYESLSWLFQEAQNSEYYQLQYAKIFICLSVSIAWGQIICKAVYMRRASRGLVLLIYSERLLYEERQLKCIDEDEA